VVDPNRPRASPSRTGKVSALPARHRRDGLCAVRQTKAGRDGARPCVFRPAFFCYCAAGLQFRV